MPLSRPGHEDDAQRSRRRNAAESSDQTRNRAAQIRRLQHAIAAGEYSVGAGKIADKLIERMRRDGTAVDKIKAAGSRTAAESSSADDRAEPG